MMQALELMAEPTAEQNEALRKAKLFFAWSLSGESIARGMRPGDTLYLSARLLAHARELGTEEERLYLVEPAQLDRLPATDRAAWSAVATAIETLSRHVEPLE